MTAKRPLSEAFLILSLFAILLLGFSSPGFSTIYYVNSAADAGGDGTTQELTGEHCAFKTIAQVNAISPAAGDSVLFNKGNTWREQLTVPTSGSDGSPITFGAYGEGADPIINGSDLITPGTSWTERVEDEDYTVTSQSTTVASDRWFRVRINAVRFAGNGSAIRVKVKSHSTTGTVIVGCSVGERSGATTDFSEVPTRLTFDSSDGVTLDAAEEKWTDWSDYDWTTTNNHLVHINIDDTAGTLYYAFEGTAYDGTYIGQNQGDQTMVQDVTDDADSAHHYIITSIEIKTTNVWEATQATETKSVYFNSTRGTKVASIVACNSANEWYWASNVLYVYSTSDPDTAYTSPGIEVTTESRKDGVALNEKDYITMDGLTIEKIERWGIDGHGDAIETGCDYITIQNCTIQHAGPGTAGEDAVGIFLGRFATNWLIDTCIMDDIEEFNETGTHAGAGIYIGAAYDSRSWPATDNIVRNCTISNVNTGITMKYASIDNIIKNNNISHFSNYGIRDVGTETDGNIIRYNYLDGSDLIENSCIETFNHAQIYYNILTNFAQYGIFIQAVSGAEENNMDSGDNNTIYNNDLYSDKASACGIIFWNDGVPTSQGNIVKNNILSGEIFRGYWIKDKDDLGSGNTFDYNCYYDSDSDFTFYVEDDGGYKTFAEWKIYAGVSETNSQESDPLMIDPANDNFKLNPHSPCVNAGTDVSLTDDYEGLKIRHAPDIGAHENQANVLFFSWFLRDFLGVNK